MEEVDHFDPEKDNEKPVIPTKNSEDIEPIKSRKPER